MGYMDRFDHFPGGCSAAAKVATGLQACPLNEQADLSRAEPRGMPTPYLWAIHQPGKWSRDGQMADLIWTDPALSARTISTVNTSLSKWDLPARQIRRGDYLAGTAAAAPACLRHVAAAVSRAHAEGISSGHFRGAFPALRQRLRRDTAPFGGSPVNNTILMQAE